MNIAVQRIGLFTLLIIFLAGSLLLLNRNHQYAPSHLNFNIIDGQVLNLEEFRGQPVLVDFWATSCKSCMHELADLITLHHDLSPRGLQIIGVAMPYDRPDRVLKTTADHQIPYPIALDVSGEITTAFGQVELTPTHFLIAPDGRIVERIVGTIDPKALREKIEHLLAESTI